MSLFRNPSLFLNKGSKGADQSPFMRKDPSARGSNLMAFARIGSNTLGNSTSGRANATYGK